MSGQEHTHPDYEDTFRRVATILDVIAQEQEKQQRLLTQTQQALADWIAWARERDAETTDKLNGLIDLVDRNLRGK